MIEEVGSRLLEAIAADRLLVLCGAGLSMAPPSNLPSATEVARTCSDAYVKYTGNPLDVTIQEDIARLSRHFWECARFENFFIAKLVPWAQLTGEANSGHGALADLLACGAVASVSTTNFDTLVEKAAANLGEPDFRAVVDAGDLAQHTPHSPYLKLHGCAVRSRQSTIWCSEQLTDAAIKQRMDQFKIWLAATLNGKDLVFVGFWSDWSYLTKLLAEQLTTVTPQHVYLVDPATVEDLEQKAPELWDWVQGADITFHHCQDSGSNFLDELRRRWSTVYINTLLNESHDTYNRLFGADPVEMVSDPSRSAEVLYALRRDLSGTSRATVVRSRHPEDEDHVAGAIHQRLLECGATYSAHRYEYGTCSLRLVSGRGRLLSRVKETFQQESPVPDPADVVICAGSVPDASPVNIVRAAGPATIVRTGALDNWTTHDQLVAELQEPHV